MDKIPADYRSNLSDNLADDHPLNIDTHPQGEVICSGCHDPHGPSGMTTHNLECTSCHEPHDDTWGKFLKTNPVQGGVCLLCHNKTNWTQSSHATSPATWNGSGTDPWPYSDWNTVSENACYNCHVSHGGTSEFWLLKSSAEEDNCLVCHNGNVSSDIQTELMKSSRHPVEMYLDIHTPNEELLSMPTHVECTDCHNPHQVSSSTATAPDITGAEQGVKGRNKDGNEVSTAQYEYEICLKCHDTDIPSIPTYGPRLDNTGSIRLDFAETNASYHPVFAQGKNSNVTSLLSPWTENSIMYCTDCHSSNGSGTGTTPKGPHGSVYAPLLKKQMIFTDNNSENSSLYALCYECHDRSKIINKMG
ncbi:MAG: cytochrome c3 family protein, partial [Fidelibacterota bacterium]